MTIPRLPIALAAAAACVLAGPGTASGAQDAPDEPVEVGVIVSGQVLQHENGEPIQGATVSLGQGPSGMAGRGSRVTGPAGRFRFEGVPVGLYELTVSAPGFRDMADTLDVPEGDSLAVVLPLSTEAIRLEPVVVTGRPRAPIAAFERRRRGGGSGFLITREDIEGERIRNVSELLHRVPGGIVVPAQPSGYALLLRGQCQPGIWMDGTPVPGVRSIDQLITPQDLEAVEVYHGFELPVEYGVNACGGILVWSRMGPTIDARSSGEREPGSGFVANLVKVAAIVVAVILFTR